MPDPITFSLILGAAINGAGGALAGKSTDAAPSLAQRVRRSAGLVEEEPLTEIEEAVARAVEAARRDIRQKAVNGLLEADDDTEKNLIALLDHPPFAEAVTARLLYRGQPNFERLRRAYIEVEGEAATPRWLALTRPLLAFFDAIESHLMADPHFGDLLRDMQELALLTGIEESQRAVAEAVRQVTAYQARIAHAAEASSTDLHTLVEQGRRQEATTSSQDTEVTG